MSVATGKEFKSIAKHFEWVGLALGGNAGYQYEIAYEPWILHVSGVLLRLSRMVAGRIEIIQATIIPQKNLFAVQILAISRRLILSERTFIASEWNVTKQELLSLRFSEKMRAAFFTAQEHNARWMPLA